MPGGLLSLLATGAQDHYINITPDMSYFKQVYKRHTNFSMESFRLTFTTKPVIMETTRNQFKCRISRFGDLLQQVYLYFELPEIYSSDRLQFRWINQIANYMIYQYNVTIDTQLIDQKWGEWMDIWNELILTADKKYGYDKMIGNVEEFVAPTNLSPTVIVRNNRLYYSSYPIANRSTSTPSIRSKSFYVPLDFWFTKNSALALPLIALQYQNIDVTIELRPIYELYQVYDMSTGKFISPNYYIQKYPERASEVTIDKFTKDNSNIIDLNAYLECNYIFLDNAERTYIASNTMDVLVERVYNIQQSGLISGYNFVDLNISNSIKEILWVLRRGDINNYNNWTNLTPSIPEDNTYSIMRSGKIIWNGMDRFEEKPYEYFNLLQPYQHHTSAPRSGVHTYSFALYPEKNNPSGTYNGSMINKQQLTLTLNKFADVDEFDISIYAVYYNVFRVMAGHGSMVFAS